MCEMIRMFLVIKKTGPTDSCQIKKGENINSIYDSERKFSENIHRDEIGDVNDEKENEKEQNKRSSESKINIGKDSCQKWNQDSYEWILSK
jgi:hypothetical protein